MHRPTSIFAIQKNINGQALIAGQAMPRAAWAVLPGMPCIGQSASFSSYTHFSFHHFESSGLCDFHARSHLVHLYCSRLLYNLYKFVHPFSRAYHLVCLSNGSAILQWTLIKKVHGPMLALIRYISPILH